MHELLSPASPQSGGVGLSGNKSHEMEAQTSLRCAKVLTAQCGTVTIIDCRPSDVLQYLWNWLIGPSYEIIHLLLEVFW